MCDSASLAVTPIWISIGFIIFHLTVTNTVRFFFLLLQTATRFSVFHFHHNLNHQRVPVTPLLFLFVFVVEIQQLLYDVRVPRYYCMIMTSGFSFKFVFSCWQLLNRLDVSWCCCKMSKYLRLRKNSLYAWNNRLRPLKLIMIRVVSVRPDVDFLFCWAGHYLCKGLWMVTASFLFSYHEDLCTYLPKSVKPCHL